MVKPAPLGDSMRSLGNDTGSYYDIEFNNPEFRPRKKFPSNEIRTTKYTVLTFLPVNLFSQFRRFYNLYFLLGAVLSLIPSSSPFSPFTQVIPLLLVLTVTAIKDAYEDFLRYLADRKANRTLYRIIRNGDEKEIKSKDILSGDFVYVEKGLQFPADLVLFSSSEKDGTCFIDTCELDGETNLKRRNALAETAAFRTIDDIISLRGSIHCDLPNEHMYRFNGRLLLNESGPVALTSDQTLLRGATLRNTGWVYGIVVYAGKDTKIIRNLKNTGLKFSSQEAKLNKLVIGIFVFNAIIFLISLLLTGLFQSRTGRKSWYLEWNEPGVAVVGVHAMTFFVIYTYMIPISLFVTIELVRLIQGLFMFWDNGMKSDDGVPMIPKNSNLNEDLGAISHIFTDKTGTLTQNVMKLVRWTIEGDVYNEEDQPGILFELNKNSSMLPQEKVVIFHRFLRCLAICNTVIPSIDEETLEMIYETQSPDEGAILEGLRRNDVLMVERSLRHMVLRIFGVEERYEILDTLEFTSDRRRMSVLVRNSKGEIELYTKGADSIVLARLVDKTDKILLNAIEDDMHEFSRVGLRILVSAYRQVPDDEYAVFKKDYEAARNELVDREEKVEVVCDVIERNLQLLGSTAVEDKLQDKAEETIDYLLKCGIHIWMLTGDKQETAVNIGYSSHLFYEEMELFTLNASTSSACQMMLTEFIDKARISDSIKGMVIDGATLTYALRDWPDLFLELSEMCKSVICCRVTPLQKSQVVKLVKRKLKRITLSIGDGANDVSMIQTANVGVGISGKEGAQAARASDYSFVQFKCLKRLLAVHGRYSYLRMSTLICYSFYKNLAFILVQFWFGFFSGWSGQIIYQEIVMSLFNVIYTSMVPAFLAVFEKDVSEDIIDKYPWLYRSVRNGLYFNFYVILGFILAAVWHSLVIFFGLYFLFYYSEDNIQPNGLDAGFWVFAYFASSMAIPVVWCKSALITKHWTWLNFFAITFSIAMYIGMLFVLVPVFDYLAGVPSTMFTNPNFYWILVLVISASLLPDYVLKYYLRQYRPADWEVLQERRVLYKHATI